MDTLFPPIAVTAATAVPNVSKFVPYIPISGQRGEIMSQHMPNHHCAAICSADETRRLFASATVFLKI